MKTTGVTLIALAMVAVVVILYTARPTAAEFRPQPAAAPQPAPETTPTAPSEAMAGRALGGPSPSDKERGRHQALINEKQRQQRRWVAALKEVDRLYGAVLPAAGLDEDQLARVKEILADRIFAIEEVQVLGRTTSSPDAVPAAIRAVGEEHDAEIRAIVSAEAADKIFEMVRVGQYLARVQLRYLAPIAKESTALTAGQTLALGQILYEIREPYVTNYNPELLKTLVARTDGLNQFDRMFLQKAQTVLDPSQLIVLKKIVIQGGNFGKRDATATLASEDDSTTSGPRRLQSDPNH